MQTVFIPISRGFIVRNIVRSGVVAHLIKAGARVVIFFPVRSGESVPEDLRTEIEGMGAIVEGVVERAPRGYSLFARYASMLVYTQTTWAYSQVGNQANMQRSSLWKYLERGIYSILGLFVPLKHLVRWIEQRYFFVPEYGRYFDTYQPSVVFGTSIVSRLDIMFLKEARRRGIRTVAMPKGWDNVVKMLYRFVPDLLLVQNTLMKEGMARVQKVPKEHIQVVGFPQFDWFTRTDILRPRDEFIRSLGLDPARKLIVFGSEGVWAKDDARLAEYIAGFVNDGKSFSTPASLFIRPHFSDVKTGRFDRFSNIENVAVDRNIRLSNFFMDNWDPDVSETIYFTNLMHHADVLVSTVSTLSLDAACADTPIVNTLFGALYDKKGEKDITEVLYQTDHYHWVMNTGAVTVVPKLEEFAPALAAYLRDGSIKREERKLLVERICNGNDGHASERIAEAILGRATV